jgi:tRNA 2-thiouridine synthesizing protein A
MRSAECGIKARCRPYSSATIKGFTLDIKEIKPDEVLDTVGLACPLPIFKTSNKIKEMKPGQVLEVQSDDDGIEMDMPAWCRRTGHEYLGLTKENGEYRVYVRRM